MHIVQNNVQLGLDTSADTTPKHTLNIADQTESTLQIRVGLSVAAVECDRAQCTIYSVHCVQCTVNNMYSV